MPSYEHYRSTSLGVALLDTLDLLILQNKITPQLAMYTLLTFDEMFQKMMSEKIHAKAVIKVRGGMESSGIEQ